jgi:hypothetical protein
MVRLLLRLLVDAPLATPHTDSWYRLRRGAGLTTAAGEAFMSTYVAVDAAHTENVSVLVEVVLTFEMGPSFIRLLAFTSNLRNETLSHFTGLRAVISRVPFTTIDSCGSGHRICSAPDNNHSFLP